MTVLILDNNSNVHRQGTTFELLSGSTNNDEGTSTGIQQSNRNCVLRDCAKKKISQNPRLLWKWVGGSRSHSELFF